MSKEKVLLVHHDPKFAQLLEKAALRPVGFHVTYVSTRPELEAVLSGDLPDLVFLGDRLEDADGFSVGKEILERAPHLPIIYIPAQAADAVVIEALRRGFFDCLTPPVHPAEVQDVVWRALEHRKQLEEWAQKQVKRNTKSLQNKVDNLEALQRVGRQVTSSLDLDAVLSAVVDAAVELTGAEEGSLLLLDEPSEELYMRAARNFNDEFVRTFRLPINDSLAGQVLRTGKPVLIDEKTPQKIKTAYLVYTLIYVPLQIHDRVIGVLGVDNRQRGHSFTDTHVTLVSALADYASIAVENARLYSRTDVERSKLETILTKVEDGVVVVDHEARLILINRTAREAFKLDEGNLIGQRVRDAISHPEVVEILSEEERTTPFRAEITLEDGRIMNAQVTPIPEVGAVMTMQDITHLKELDRIKSEFVSAVSHDLRSPLTAILGYVELIDRVGPINDQQREFIRRVQISVQSITALINDLLDLGRIEAGFDARKEIVHPDMVIQFVVDSLRSRITEKAQDIVIEIEDDLPQVVGNPIRIRQMLANLLGNAVKYTQNEGQIMIRAHSEAGQIILEICDNGPGIPPADQPFIFDKFYRASNISPETPGTGLGLAIVKSIVENHQGRIWVDSTPGLGTTFTIVLPIADGDF
jgi:two-component system, OmpR family, phosphate regulon sensor histidine kinase PhoR